MPQVINTNIASLTAQRNLNQSQDALQTSLERLSSGLRINSAKDDAAGLAISERFTSQVNGLNQAVRNANDGISFAQTAEGALGEIGNALQRIRQLAVQSANDTNSSSDRQALNNEVSSLISEVNRIAESTQFNGQNVLNGALEELTFQVGANEGQTIAVDGVDARGSKLGALTIEGDSIRRGDLTANGGTLTINGTDVDLSAAEDVNDVIDTINKNVGAEGVTAQKATKTNFDLTFTTANISAGGSSISINGVDVSIADGDTVGDVVDSINAVSGQTGVEVEIATGSTLSFTSENGASVDIADDASVDLLSTVDAAGDTYDAGVVLVADVEEEVIVGGTVTGSGLTANTYSGSDSLSQSTVNVLNDVSVVTGEDAASAISTADFALGKVNGLRAELGAVQSRFESTIANLSTTSENLSAARSRIQDADFAAETASLTKAQILQQAGTSVLAQANQIPQNVLSLLQ